MWDEIRYQTPEEVSLNFIPAGLGTRFTAFLIDSALQFVFMFLLVLILFLVGFVSSIDRIDLSKWYLVFLIALISVFYLGYFIFFEWLWNGQTPGKRMMRIVVMRDGAFPLNIAANLIRNFFRLIDNVPVLWIVPILSRSHKRIGDYVAGTLAIQMPQEQDTLPYLGRSYSEITAPRFSFGRSELKKVTQADFRLLEQYHCRVHDLPVDTRLEFQSQLQTQFSQKLELEVPDHQAAIFLKELYLFVREERNKEI